MNNPKGSVLVVGGGITGVQTALDLADSGFYVYLVERTAAIGGVMSQLDKTFPTNDCSACILSPKLVECGRHLNIQLLTLAELVSLNGEPGNFRAVVRETPRYVDVNKCIACGMCAEKCPKVVPNEFNNGLGTRKAAYLKFPQAVPLKYAIDARHCIWLNKPGRCGACAKACPAGAIDFNAKPKEHVLEVGAVALALGFDSYDPSPLDFTGYGRVKNVVTALEFERLLSPSGPCLGHMERPSDRKIPKKIAWLQCVGSRDINRAAHSYCSAVCCMYAIKQAVIAREHAGGQLDASIFYMDMRCHGKEFERYYERAKASGVRFVRSRVHSIWPAGAALNTGKGFDYGQDILLRYSDEDGHLHDEVFDLAVLSVGMQPSSYAANLLKDLNISVNEDGFVSASAFSPVATSRPGIFVCGPISGPKDIPQSVTEASSVAAEISAMLAPARWQATKIKEFPPERDVSAEAPRIGVFVCHCGINIASVVDVRRVAEYARTLPGVVFVQDNLFTCSQDTIVQMVETIRREGLNRVVVASCTPRTHEPLFQETLREAGLNRYLFEMANIRDQDSWVHQNEPEKATEKAKDLVRMAVAKVRGDHALAANQVPVHKMALVIGAGATGMTAALSLADQGFPVHLVDKADVLGGNARRLYRTWQGEEVKERLEKLIEQVKSHSNITLHLSTELDNTSGSVGRFKTRLSNGREIEHGVAIIAVGGQPWKPIGDWQYLYGEDERVKTLLEVDELCMADEKQFSGLKNVVFVHCVGSRIPERPYCSRVCCTHAIDQALKLKELNPDMNIFMLYRDIRTYGQRERLYQEARAKGIVFIRYDLNNRPVLSRNGDGLVMQAVDHVLKRPVAIHSDMVVLATAVEPRSDAKSLSKFFKCSINADGFLMEAHAKLRPVDFATDGVFLAGLCHYPKPIEESIAQAKAAAIRAARVLAQNVVSAESAIAVVNPNKCVTCGVCAKICPYAAISKDPVIQKASVDSSLCKGCGACVAACRSDAITLKNMGNEQIMAAIEAVMWE
ncbi:MAG: FAD-dependent oxidoreductase [Dissulfuribacterales bacterium]